MRLRPHDPLSQAFLPASSGFCRGHAVAQQVVDSLVVSVERATVFVRLGAQLIEGHSDLCQCVAALGQPRRKQPFLDFAVALAVGLVAEAAVAQFVKEQGDDAVLRDAFGLAQGGHLNTSQRPPLRRLK